MLIVLEDGPRRKQSSISEIGLSTKPARSLEKFTEDSGDYRLSRGPEPRRRAVWVRPVDDSSDPVFRCQFARQV